MKKDDESCFVFYLPYADRIDLPEKYKNYSFTAIDLQKRRIMHIIPETDEKGLFIPQQFIAEDMLIIGTIKT